MDISPFQGNLGGEYPYTIRMTQKEYHHAWYEANKDRLRETYQQNYLKRKAENPEKVREQHSRSAARWRAAHPEYKPIRSEATRIKDRERRKQNSERIKQQKRDAMRRAYAANPEKYRNRSKTWRLKNLSLDGERQKKYRRKRLPLFRAYYQNRLDTDRNFKIAHLLRGRLRKALRRGTKTGSAVELLGCSIENFRLYIETKFESGMTWDNIHIDHIIPCTLFDMTNPEHQRQCFHFSNLQPLFAVDNLRKGAKHKEAIL